MPLDPILAAQAAVTIIRSLPGLGGPPLAPGFFRPHRRSIGGIFAHVTIEEDERDEVTVTEHPVEQGAPISDHAFKRQEEVTIRCGWNLWDGDLSAESGVYGLLLNWQASFILFDLTTGKRIHRNMLITSLSVTTNQETEYALMATLTCREVILTKTETSKPKATGDDEKKESPSENSTGSKVKRGSTTASEGGDYGGTYIDPVLELGGGSAAPTMAQTQRRALVRR